jgi:hypothetical protein
VLTPVAIIIEVVHQVDPGVTESDFVRWVGVLVAVAGAILATPEGIASLARSIKKRSYRGWTFVRRLMRLTLDANVHGVAAHARIGMSGRVRASKWREWLPQAEADLKIDILHRQAEILREQINGLQKQIDRTDDDLHKRIREAENRVLGQLQQLASELRGERSQASHVDARGLGPIALGIILTGLPDELAATVWVGYVAIGISVCWTAAVTPSWLRDYKRALEDVDD